MGRIQLIFFMTYLFFGSSVPLWAQEQSLSTLAENDDLIAPLIDHTPPGEILVGKPIEAKVTDNKKIADVLLHYRFSSEPFLVVNMREKQDGIYSLVIPQKDAIKLDYYIEAFDETGNASQKGNPTSPLTVVIKKRPSILKKPLFWVAVAVIAGFAMEESIEDKKPTPVW